jgi:hypothetical protein
MENPNYPQNNPHGPVGRVTFGPSTTARDSLASVSIPFVPIPKSQPKDPVPNELAAAILASEHLELVDWLFKKLKEQYGE